MKTPIQRIENDMVQIADYARDLLAATANSTEEQVKEVRAKLAAALDDGRTFVSRVRDRAASGTQACDLAIHENPYFTAGIAIAVGALIGFLAVRENAHCKR